MKGRPDWVHCVGFGNAIRTDGKMSWCGKSYELQPFFHDIDHAALNGENGGRLVACPECVDEIIKGLKNGH